VPPSALFLRLDAFAERCADLLELCQTASQYARLEKVEVGGTKGRTTTACVRALHSDFSACLARFHGISYDLLDIDCRAFDADYAAFRAAVRELDRRLAAAIGTAMDDCHAMGRSFKLLDSFEGVLERDAVLADLEKKHLALITEFCVEVRTVAELFTSGRAAPVLPKNAAPHSGAVAWTRALRQRVEEPMERLRGLGCLLADSAEGAELEASHAQLLSQLTDFEAATIRDWSAHAEETGEERLKQALLVRDVSGTIAVNFDPALTKLLREVRYFQLQGVEVPPGAARVFKRGEVLRQQTGNTELAARLYNDAQRVLLPVERPLVEKKLENVSRWPCWEPQPH
jgi:dynein heavy chain